MNNMDLIISTIKKVYSIRHAVEKRAMEKNPFNGIPLLEDIAYRLSSDALSKDQMKDISAFVTATCPNEETLVIMERISAFKAGQKVDRPLKVLLSYVGLILPILIVILIEAYMVYLGIITEMPYLILTFVLILAAIIISVLLFAYLGYDPVYRRDMIENHAWKAIHKECEYRLNLGGQKRLTD
ncbi:hypothetical protein CUJ83_06200 [Methanocella sp. CWC-04]|uniref:Uncharacterized protein n=1 Tax=Methanooceanicella nereidis TaxID=2052831 RepID=A0AAP2RC21_9EURY|nr:hypothetical protein [Methanocella sp. CWC-04]MCD1294593.1 hypothetical protein [Methanocella sp. CWC-04]